MTRYAEIEKALRQWAELEDCGCVTAECEGTCLPALSSAALALPEDSKTVNAELYGLAIQMADICAEENIECFCRRVSGYYDPQTADNWRRSVVDNSLRYLSLREASGEPMPYKVIRDGGKVRFESNASDPKTR